MKRPKPTGPAYASIRADEILPLAVLRQRLGWGSRTVAQAQRDGLRTIKYGRWGYVKGADLLKFFDEVSTRESSEATKNES